MVTINRMIVQQIHLGLFENLNIVANNNTVLLLTTIQWQLISDSLNRYYKQDNCVKKVATLSQYLYVFWIFNSAFFLVRFDNKI